MKNDDVMPAGKKPLFSNGSASSSISAEVFILEQKKKTNLLIFYMKISKEICNLLQSIDFEKMKKNRFSRKKIVKNAV